MGGPPRGRLRVGGPRGRPGEGQALASAATMARQKAGRRAVRRVRWCSILFLLSRVSRYFGAGRSPCWSRCFPVFCPVLLDFCRMPAACSTTSATSCACSRPLSPSNGPRSSPVRSPTGSLSSAQASPPSPCLASTCTSLAAVSPVASGCHPAAPGAATTASWPSLSPSTTISTPATADEENRKAHGRSVPSTHPRLGENRLPPSGGVLVEPALNVGSAGSIALDRSAVIASTSFLSDMRFKLVVFDFIIIIFGDISRRPHPFTSLVTSLAAKPEVVWAA
jgi:hypothetical protein